MKPCFHLGNSREFLGQSSFPSKGVLFPYSSKTSLPMDILPSSLDSFHTHGCVPQAPIDRVSVVVSSLKQLFQGHKHKLIAPQVTVAADGSMIVHDGPWVPPIQETHTHNAVLHWPEQKLHWASCPGHGRRKTCFKQRKKPRPTGLQLGFKGCSLPTWHARHC